MRTTWTVAFLLAGALWADEAADRRAIEGILERLNFAAERATLFAAGADLPAELRRLERADCNMGSSKIWSEVPSPRFTRPAVQFIAPDVAVADLEYVQYSSLVASVRTPVVVVLKREAREWKIATLRVVGDCSGAPRSSRPIL